jgi:hypothetical protein
MSRSAGETLTECYMGAVPIARERLDSTHSGPLRWPVANDAEGGSSARPMKSEA